MANTIFSHYIVEGEFEALTLIADTINLTVSKYKQEHILEHNLTGILESLVAFDLIEEGFVAGDWYDAKVVDGPHGVPVLSFMEDYNWIPSNVMEELARSGLFTNRIDGVFRASVDDEFELVECTDKYRKYFMCS